MVLKPGNKVGKGNQRPLIPLYYRSFQFAKLRRFAFSCLQSSNSDLAVEWINLAGEDRSLRIDNELQSRLAKMFVFSSDVM